MKKFCKKLFLKISQYSRKKPVLETLFNLEYCEIFQSTYFEEHLQTAAKMFMKLKKVKSCWKFVDQ